jgi:hypothetical protein
MGRTRPLVLLDGDKGGGVVGEGPIGEAPGGSDRGGGAVHFVLSSR